MAIFGAGSNWDGNEIKQTMFKDNNYLIGWDIVEAEDLYTLIASIKVGDIIYLKSNRPGSLNIRIKGIGLVTDSLMQKLFKEKIDLSNRRANFELPIHWIYKDEFTVSITPNTGKLTNIRAATLYEEYLPFIQTEVLKILFSRII